MHPNEERPPQGYWEVDDPPDPTVAQTEAEFVAELSELLRWSRLSLGEIEHRATAHGGLLPQHTVSELLHAGTLPGEELLVSLLWAVGCDDDTVQLWVWARERLAAASTQRGPAEIYWVPDKPTGYSEGALAHAIRERRNQSGWRGLHRHTTTPDAGDARHAAKRLRRKGFLSLTGWGAGWSSRAIIGLVAGTLAFTGGFAALSGTDETAVPPTGSRDGQDCCLGSPESGSPSLAATQESIVATATPTSSASARPVVNPTPRPTVTTQGPMATPTPTPTPQLTGSGSTTCVRADGRWFVDVAVTATLTGAASGTDPQGRASQGGGSENAFPLSGSGNSSFSGQTRIDVGPDTAAVAGTIQWSVTVTVPGRGAVDASGAESFSCS